MEKPFIEGAIDEVEGALNRRLQKLKKDSKQHYIDESKLNLHEISKILCEIQVMKENLILFGEQIDTIMNQILDDYSQVRANVGKAIADL